MLKEWSLVAFTVLGQMAVGLFILGATPFLPIYEVPGFDPGGFLALLASVLGLLAVAALISFLHLRHPLKAVRALANFRTSWLSREIFFELLFMALVAVELVMVWAGATLTFLWIVHITAGLAGVLFLLSMIKIYMLEALPGWNQAATPLSFVSASLSLGALTAGGINGSSEFYFLAILFVFADLVISLLYAPGHGFLVRRAGEAIRPPAMLSRGLYFAGLGIEATGLALLVWAFLLLDRLYEAVPMIAVFGLILGGIVIRRFLFYGLAVRPGR